MPLPPWLEILEARIEEYYQADGMEAIPPELLNAYSQGLYAEGFMKDALDAADFQATLLPAESGSLLQRNTQLRYDLRQAMGTLNTSIPSEELSNWQQRMEAILIDAAG
ncbi:MAG: hypothetical protein H6642_12560 [Caldilineaceae bacterium]|nr:hypothetical protein [Caldilineaceae bacterium]